MPLRILNRMKFSQRKEFLYDDAVFKRKDSDTAAKIYDEYVRKFSPIPPPKFFEVNREGSQIDPLWHSPVGDRVQFSRELAIPAINFHDKPQWTLTPTGYVAKRNDKFCLSQVSLVKFDWFPMRGDMVFFNGYRYMIINTVLPPEAYWAQTNFWIGIYVECVIAPEGDARPQPDQSKRGPNEFPIINV